MRTTLSLDDDVAARLRRLRSEDPRAFKAIVNDLLRRGLDARSHEPSDDPGPYTTPQDLGGLRIASIDDVSEALGLAEGDDHR